jgi:hypothetical protein
VLVLGIGLVLIMIWLQFSINRETVSTLEVINPQGKVGTALIVYHPGLSDLQDQLTSAFTKGLSENGWRVERTTTSTSAPTTLTNYDLLVLGVHTYWWSPDGPTLRYLKRVGDLQEKPTLALLSALGATGRSERITRARIEAAKGKVVAVHPFWVMRPNKDSDQRPNREVALDMAYQVGLKIALP